MNRQGLFCLCVVQSDEIDQRRGERAEARKANKKEKAKKNKGSSKNAQADAEAEVERLTTELARIEREMGEPKAVNNQKVMNQLLVDYDTAKAALDEAEAAWLEMVG